jgi:hypothetical protein
LGYYTGRGEAVRLSIWCVNADFGGLAAAMGDRKAEDFEFGHEERGARAGGGGDGVGGGVVVRVGLADDINGTLAAGDVENFGEESKKRSSVSREIGRLET